MRGVLTGWGLLKVPAVAAITSLRSPGDVYSSFYRVGASPYQRRLGCKARRLLTFCRC